MASKSLSGGVTTDDMEGVRQEWEEVDPNISKLLENLDRELLLVLRTTQILRGINVQLGGNVNRYNVNALSALKGIHLREKTSSLRYWFEVFNMRMTFFLARAATLLNHFLFGNQMSYITTGERN